MNERAKHAPYSLVGVRYNPALYTDDNGHEFGRIAWIDGENRTVYTFLPVEIVRRLDDTADTRAPQNGGGE